MNLGELFKAAIENKRGSQYSDEDIQKAIKLNRQYNHHTRFRPGMKVQMSDREYVVGRNGNFMRVRK